MKGIKHIHLIVSEQDYRELIAMKYEGETWESFVLRKALGVNDGD